MLAQRLASVGVGLQTGRPIMGSKGPVVQAHSTWFPEQRAVRCHGDRNGLDRSRRPAWSCAAVAGVALGRPYAAFAAAAVSSDYANFALFSCFVNGEPA